MIQLNFDAPTAEEALQQQPVEVGYSQHEGAERASWGASKLEIVDGTHPVVSVAAGSHANFYGQALYLGSSASEGVGCDDTRGPSDDVRPVVETIPSDPTEAHARSPGSGSRAGGASCSGRSSTGRPARTSSASGRSRSSGPKAGAAGAMRSRRAACSAPGRPTSSAGPSRAAPTSCGASCTSRALSSSRSRSSSCWRCSGFARDLAADRAARACAAGGRGARSSPPPGACTGGTSALFLGIGLLLVPISLLVALLQSLMLKTSSFVGISTEGQGAGLLVLLLVALGAALTLLAIGLVQVATARALVEIAHGRPVGPVGAYRLAARGVWPLLGALVIAAVAVVLLASSSS